MSDQLKLIEGGGGRKFRSPCPPGEVRDRRKGRGSVCRRDKRRRSPSKISKESYELDQLKRKVKHLYKIQKKYSDYGAERVKLYKYIDGKNNWELEDPVADEDGDYSVILRAEKDLNKAVKSIQKFIREHRSDKIEQYLQDTFYTY